jgi:hypothetical protein
LNFLLLTQDKSISGSSPANAMFLIRMLDDLEGNIRRPS